MHLGQISLVGDEPAEPQPSTRPLFLLADSQLLFWDDAGGRFVQRLAEYAGGGAFRAAYLGASNGDQPEYFQLFQAAMAGLDAECRMIPAVPSSEDMAFLRSAGLVLLAGGDVQRGWTAFERSGVREAVAQRHQEGAVLVGVSAGAVQLGMAGWPEGSTAQLFATWGLVPFLVDAHAEDDEWAELRAAVLAHDGQAVGFGIPRGGGMAYHPDGTVEPIRHPLVEVRAADGRVTTAMVLPSSAANADADADGFTP
jgi:peptidase E